MKATTNEGRQIDGKPDAFDALRERVAGPVLLPDDGGYEDSRAVWNAMIDCKPTVVARRLAVWCVRIAGEDDLPLCLQGDRLHIAGLKSSIRTRKGLETPAVEFSYRSALKTFRRTGKGAPPVPNHPLRRGVSS